MEAPRWRLTSAHYLNVPGTEWERQELNMQSQSMARQRFVVPMLVDPKDPKSTRGQPEDEVYVAHEGSKYSRDIIFIGDPTPEMEPMNEEAEAITNRLRPSWSHPVDALPGTFNQSMLIGLEKQLAEAIARAGGIPKEAPNVGGVSAEDFAALQAQVQTLMEQNAALLAQLTGDKTEGRRV